MSSSEDQATPETDYHFPIEGITVRAHSEVEAREKLERIIKEQRSTNEGEEK
jgi:hypothetical protein